MGAYTTKYFVMSNIFTFACKKNDSGGFTNKLPENRKYLYEGPVVNEKYTLPWGRPLISGLRQRMILKFRLQIGY